MRALSSGLQAIVDSRELAPAYLFKIVRDDGVAYRYTDHDASLTVDLGDGDGAQEYVSGLIEELSEVQGADGGRVDGFEFNGATTSLDIAGIDVEDIKLFRLDNSVVTIAICHWPDVSLGGVILQRGYARTVKRGLGRWGIEAQSLIGRIDTDLHRTIKPLCDNDLGDTRCGVVMSAPPWASATAYSANAGRDAKTGAVVSIAGVADRWLKCTIAGTSGGSAPNVPATLGDIVTDGGVTWTAVPALRRAGEVVSVQSKVDLTIDVDAADGFFTGGRLTFSSGRHQGKGYDIVRHEQSVDVTGIQQLMVTADANSNSVNPARSGSIGISTARAKFGAGSLLFAPGGDINPGTGSNYGFDAGDDIGNGPFELDGWVWLDNLSNELQVIASRWGASVGNFDWYLARFGAGLRFAWTTDGLEGSVQTIDGPISWVAGRAYKFGVGRDDLGVVRLWIDGVVIASQSMTDTINFGTAPFYLGQYDRPSIESDAPLYGGLDDVRFLVGGYVHNTDYTPETLSRNDPASLASRLTLLQAPPVPISAGDQFVVTAGCRKTREACQGFENIRNSGGFFSVPGQKIRNQRATQ